MSKSLSINAVVEHYKESGGFDNPVKLFFKKDDVRKHKSDTHGFFYTVRPIVVKIGDWFDEHIDFLFVIKNKYIYIMNVKDCDIWCLEVDNKVKVYKPSDDIEFEYHDTKLKFIASPIMKDRVLKLYMTATGTSEAEEDYV